MEINLNNYVIVDSSYLVSLSHEKDALYVRANEIASSLSSQIIIILPAEVFSETINTLWKKVDKELAIQIAKSILSSKIYTFAETTGEIRASAIKIFEAQNKSVSYTDCVVMAFADSYKTKKILGFDETFTQNGYAM